MGHSDLPFASGHGGVGLGNNPTLKAPSLLQFRSVLVIGDISTIGSYATNDHPTHNLHPTMELGTVSTGLLSISLTYHFLIWYN